MIRLIQFEMAKLWHKKLFLLLSLATLVLLLLNFYQQCREAGAAYPKDVYMSRLAGYQSMPENERIPNVSKELDCLSMTLVSRHLASYDATEAQIEVWYQDILQKYDLDYASAIKAYETWSAEEIDKMISVLAIIKGQLEYVDNYRIFRDGFNSRAEHLLAMPIFSEDRAYSNRFIRKSMNDYSRLEPVDIVLDYEEGIQALSGTSEPFYFVIILVFVACVMVFADETEEGLRLLQASRRGRIPLAIAKWITTLLYTLVVASLVYGGMLLIASTTLGFGDINRSLQSIANFRDCWLPLKVKDYLCLFFVLPLASFLLLNTTAALLVSLCKKVWLSSAVFLLLMGISYYGDSFISDQSSLNWMKYLNPIAMADVKSRFSIYTNVHLLGYPVSTIPAEIVVSSILFLGFSVSTPFLYCRRPRFSGIRRKKKDRHIIRGTGNLLKHEWFRFLIPSMGILGLSIIAGYSLWNVDQEPPALTAQDYYYYAYGKEIQGPVTPDLEEWFQEQRLILQEEASQANASGADGNIKFLQHRSEALERVYQEYQQLLERKDHGIQVHYISSIVTDPLFSEDAVKNLLLKTILCILLLSVCVCPIFAEDQETNLAQLVRTTFKGRNTAFFKRYIVIFFAWLFTWIAVMAPVLYNWIHGYHFDDWGAPVCSILRMSQYSGRLDVRGFLTVWELNTFISGFSCMVMLSTLSLIFKNKSSAWMAFSGLLLMDTLCSLIPIPVCDWIALTSAVELPRMSWPVFNLVKNALIASGLLLVHRKRYAGEFVKGKGSWKI